MALNHKKVSSGSKVLDELLNGGYEPGIITTIYGASGTGKSNIGILSAVNLARQGKKVVYIDSEGSFSKDRAHQIEEDYETGKKKLDLNYKFKIITLLCKIET